MNPEKSFSISPNPVHERLLIFGPVEQNVIITDIAGKYIFQTQVSPDHFLDVSFLNTGIYFLLISVIITF